MFVTNMNENGASLLSRALVVMALRNTVVVGGGLVGSAVACAIGAVNGGAGCGRVTLLDHATSAIPAPKLTHYRCD